MNCVFGDRAIFTYVIDVCFSGATAASALAAPKLSTVANPTIRPNQPISAATQLQAPVLQTSQGVQLRPPLRPSLPASQILTTTVAAHQAHQAEMQR